MLVLDNPQPSVSSNQIHLHPNSSAVVMSDESCYQQLYDPPGQLHATKTTDADDTTHPPPAVRPTQWSFADSNKHVGGEDDQPRLLSRDGSPHVTDEVFNSASHLFAAMLSLLGTVLLVTQSAGDAWKIVSFSIYGSSLMFLFACSTLHHAISSTEEVSPFSSPRPPPQVRFSSGRWWWWWRFS